MTLRLQQLAGTGNTAEALHRRTFPLLPEYDRIEEFVCENNREYKDLFDRK